jgi:hypothetical protein
VDFTNVIYYEDFKFFVAKPKEKISWSTYLDVFDLKFWITTGLTGMGITLFLFVVLAFTNPVFSHNVHLGQR